jgi:hypothetical protein
MTFEILSILVVLNLGVTFSLWRTAARRPPRAKKKFLKKLMHSEPITPKHDPPKVAGGQFASLAGDDDHRFFSDFAEFADVVNWWLSDEDFGSRWRLQELPGGDVRLNVSFSDGPILGRCYEIFHNQVRLGRLEIRPGYKYDAATPKVITEIELDMVRLLTFDNITEFLGAIAMHVCKKHPEDGEYFDANQAILGALTKALWESQTITEYRDLDAPDWGELELHLQGNASDWYFSRRELMQKQRAKRGIVPQR